MATSSANFDFDAAIRWARFDPLKALARRADSALPFVGNAGRAGLPLLLDSCVYIDGLQGRAPDAVQELIDHRLVNHSTVAVQELMHTVGRLNPSDPRTSAAVGQIRGLIKAMKPHRLFAPDADVLGRAALLSGMLCRLQGYGKEERLRALQDCVLFLQGHKLGYVVLTANVGDFDCLLQLIPAGKVLFYRNI